MTSGVRPPVEQPMTTRANDASRSLRPRTPASESHEVREQPAGTGHAGRQLPEEAQPRVHVAALAERGDEQPALERRVTGVVRLKERDVGRVPVVREVQAPLL